MLKLDAAVEKLCRRYAEERGMVFDRFVEEHMAATKQLLREMCIEGVNEEALARDILMAEMEQYLVGQMIIELSEEERRRIEDDTRREVEGLIQQKQKDVAEDRMGHARQIAIRKLFGLRRWEQSGNPLLAECVPAFARRYAPLDFETGEAV